MPSEVKSWPRYVIWLDPKIHFNRFNLKPEEPILEKAFLSCRSWAAWKDIDLTACVNLALMFVPLDSKMADHSSSSSPALTECIFVSLASCSRPLTVIAPTKCSHSSSSVQGLWLISWIGLSFVCCGLGLRVFWGQHYAKWLDTLHSLHDFPYAGQFPRLSPRPQNLQLAKCSGVAPLFILGIAPCATISTGVGLEACLSSSACFLDCSAARPSWMAFSSLRSVSLRWCSQSLWKCCRFHVLFYQYKWAEWMTWLFRIFHHSQWLLPYWYLILWVFKFVIFAIVKKMAKLKTRE